MAPSPSGWRASPAVTKRSLVLAPLFLICRWNPPSVMHKYTRKQLTSCLLFLFLCFMYMCFVISVIFFFQPKGVVTLTLSDMKVTRRHHDSWTLERDFLYSVRSVGLYIIILVPSKGITLIWDKHTRIAVELQPHWRVSDEEDSCIWDTWSRPHWQYISPLIINFSFISLLVFQNQVCGLCGNFDGSEINDLQLSDSASKSLHCLTYCMFHFFFNENKIVD